MNLTAEIADIRNKLSSITQNSPQRASALPSNHIDDLRVYISQEIADLEADIIELKQTQNFEFPELEYENTVDIEVRANSPLKEYRYSSGNNSKQNSPDSKDETIRKLKKQNSNLKSQLAKTKSKTPTHPPLKKRGLSTGPASITPQMSTKRYNQDACMELLHKGMSSTQWSEHGGTKINFD